MIEMLADMPAGTLGFRASGRISPKDYTDVVRPPLRAAIDAGERLRVLVAVGPEFHEELAAVWEGLKLDVEFGVRHRQAWEREAVVSDIAWVRRGSGLFAPVMPGEVRVFRERELPEAKAWLAA